MIQIGAKQELEIIKETDFGVYLDSIKPTGEPILLPKSQVPEWANIASVLEVFVYRDSEDRLIATTKMPLVTLGHVAKLEVVSTTRIGAFLDWGLEKDLFLPFKEQRGTIKEGSSYLVGVYVDKSNRLCASMNIYDKLHTEHDYKADDQVVGTIFSISDEKGAFIAVDNEYHGMIRKVDFIGPYKVGDSIEARVVKVQDDGKMVLSLKKKAHEAIEGDAQLILDKIDEEGGEIYVHDKSDPEVIRGYLHISKKAFKRAVGNLLKQGLVEQTGQGIKRKESPDPDVVTEEPKED